jgi:N-acetylmuramoyl-L-alanine amidase
VTGVQTCALPICLDIGKHGIDDKLGKDTIAALRSLPEAEQQKTLARAQLAAQLKHPSDAPQKNTMALADGVRQAAQAPDLKTQQAAATTASPQAAPHKGTIVIDPGHGGLIPQQNGKMVNDSGTLGKFNGKTISEAQANQMVAGELADALRARGYNVVLTKDKVNTKDIDRTPDGNATIMGERRAGKAPDALAFISIHQDDRGALPKSEANRAKMRGPVVNISPTARDVDQMLGNAVASKLGNKAIKNPRNIAVLVPGYHQGQGAPSNGVKKGASFERPAILVETSNFSDPKDVATIMDPAQRAALIDKMADGIDTGLQSPKLRTAMGLPKPNQAVAAAPTNPQAQPAKTPDVKVKSTRITAENQGQTATSPFGFLGKFSPF